MAKRISFIAFVILFSSLPSTQTTLATSGACSDHEGVNCAAGPSANGNVVCNDGWTGGSVSYDSMSECMGYDAQIIALEQQILDIKTKYQSDVAIIMNDRNISKGMAERQIDYLANKANTQIQNINLQIQQLHLNHLRQQFFVQSSPLTSGTSSSPNIVFPPTATTISYFISRNLGIGNSGSDVATLQKFLESSGFLTLPPGISEGYFGNITKQALIAFQKSVGLPATGYCGPMTRNAVGKK